ncbi:translation initiation factor IF-3 [Umboniibacter marinipuniceus]|uniref:Translation initiation factor IF-3 n=1 Tax=Umboniibacter marinipuniceus TaxID=569599 RepID=A0A3M0AEP2_9GAMM|nr:translation initiation factor 3 (bIF-3) [Umboniibacter marinipuniceus]
MIIKRDNGRERGNKVKLNQHIQAREVRLIGPNGDQIGVVALADALEAARSVELDLVEISPDAEPPVCKVMDFGKHIYELKKQKAAAKKNQVRNTVKEVKFRPGTDEGDYKIKLRNLIKFLEHGDKAKITLRYRGREMAHQDLGMQMLKRLEGDLEEYGSVEMYPKMEGRQLTMVVAPKKKK